MLAHERKQTEHARKETEHARKETEQERKEKELAKDAERQAHFLGEVQMASNELASVYRAIDGAGNRASSASSRSSGSSSRGGRRDKRAEDEEAQALKVKETRADASNENVWEMCADDLAALAASTETVAKRWRALVSDDIMIVQDERALNGQEGGVKESYKARFEELKRARETAGGSFENNKTQPFVNGLLREAFGELDRVFKERVSAEASEYDKARELFLHTEKKQAEGDQCTKTLPVPRTAGSRYVDAALFERGSGCENDDSALRYDKAARARTILAVEAKRVLDSDHFIDALGEVERDFVRVAGRWARATMPVGHSIITDGVEWIFLRMWWTFDRDKKTWMRVRKQSERIDLSHGDSAWQRLAQWLVFSFKTAMCWPEMATGFVFEFEGYELVGAMSAGTRSTTWRWRRTGDESAIAVLKTAAFFASDRQAHLWDAIERERAFLSLLSGCQHVISLLNSASPFMRSLWLENGVTSLARMDISGKRGRLLAKVVLTSIVDGALPALARLACAESREKKGLVHCDIHLGNIVVTADREVAKLIDLESARWSGDSLEGAAMLVHHNDFAEADPSLDTRNTAAVLAMLWRPSYAFWDTDTFVPLAGGFKAEYEALFEEVRNGDAAIPPKREVSSRSTRSSGLAKDH